jgi:hypothetical protein
MGISLTRYAKMRFKFGAVLVSGLNPVSASPVTLKALI